MPNVQPAVAATWTPYQWEVFNAFNDSAYVRDQMDIQQTPLYDTVTQAANTALTVTSTAFFTNVGAGSSKTINQTNLTRANELIAPEAFSIKQFRLRFSENILLADFVAIMNGFDFEFYIGKKVYMQLPIWMCPAGGGIFGFPATTNATTQITTWQNGWPSNQAARTIALPLVISSKASFSGQLNGPSYTLTASGSSGTGAIIVCVLEGFYARGVQ
jgi:hypothetical protein